MTYYQLFRKFVDQLSAYYTKGEADAITNIIFQHLCKKSRTDILADSDLIVEESLLVAFNICLDRLKVQEPVQYVTGVTEFCNLNFKVNANVLIPRPETEELVLMAIRHISSNKSVHSLLDIGSGSGCIPVTIKKNHPEVSVTSIDISKDALMVATENANVHQTDINFIEMDFLNRFSTAELGKFDLIVSNPPYIPETERISMDKNVYGFEPNLALFVRDDDPLIFYKQIASFVMEHLNEKGVVFLETHRQYANEVLNIFENIGCKGSVIKDMFGNDRFVQINRFL